MPRHAPSIPAGVSPRAISASANGPGIKNEMDGAVEFVEFVGVGDEGNTPMRQRGVFSSPLVRKKTTDSF